MYQTFRDILSEIDFSDLLEGMKELNTALTGLARDLAKWSTCRSTRRVTGGVAAGGLLPASLRSHGGPLWQRHTHTHTSCSAYLMQACLSDMGEEMRDLAGGCVSLEWLWKLFCLKER